jgi:hypothetical protein
VSGITSSKIGHLEGQEIVQVEYDPSRTNLRELVHALKSNSSFYSVIVSDEAGRHGALKSVSSSEVKIRRSEPHFIESKYSLRTIHPELYYLDLDEKQAIGFNAWSYFGGRMPDLLTEEQKRLLPQMKEALRRKSASGLKPARDGKELEAYRKQMLQWLVQ